MKARNEAFEALQNAIPTESASSISSQDAAAMSPTNGVVAEQSILEDTVRVPAAVSDSGRQATVEDCYDDNEIPDIPRMMSETSPYNNLPSSPTISPDNVAAPCNPGGTDELDNDTKILRKKKHGPKVLPNQNLRYSTSPPETVIQAHTPERSLPNGSSQRSFDRFGSVHQGYSNPHPNSYPFSGRPQSGLWPIPHTPQWDLGSDMSSGAPSGAGSSLGFSDRQTSHPAASQVHGMSQMPQPHGDVRYLSSSGGHRFPPGSSHNSLIFTPERLPLSGYQLLAEKLTGGLGGAPVTPVYRRFGLLGHRLLLRLQDEIAELEEQLDALDASDTQRRQLPGGVYPASRRYDSVNNSDIYMQQREILGSIGYKLGQYSRSNSRMDLMITSGVSKAELQIMSCRLSRTCRSVRCLLFKKFTITEPT